MWRHSSRALHCKLMVSYGLLGYKSRKIQDAQEIRKYTYTLVQRMVIYRIKSHTSIRRWRLSLIWLIAWACDTSISYSHTGITLSLGLAVQVCWHGLVDMSESRRHQECQCSGYTDQHCRCVSRFNAAQEGVGGLTLLYHCLSLCQACVVSISVTSDHIADISSFYLPLPPSLQCGAKYCTNEV